MKQFIRTLSCIALAGFGLALLANANQTASTEQTASAEPKWLENTQEVLELAKKENKPILINFTGSDWCPPCIMLKQQVFGTPAFKDFADKNLVLQVADFPRGIEQPEDLQHQNLALAQKYGIQGFPTLVILDSEGKPIGRMGFTPGGPKAFIPKLEKILKQ